MSKRSSKDEMYKSSSEDESSPDTSSTRRKKKKFVRAQTVFQSESTWTVMEKQKLLEALKKFSVSSVECISDYVGTKTPEEVTAKIDNIRKSQTVIRQKKLQRTSNDRRAPLEVWLPLVMELVSQEKMDLSENLSKVINILGSYETPRHSFHPKLNWRNIYQYLGDLLEDRAHHQALTDLEAYVVLDLIHDLGSTLRNADTQEHRQILNLKYKLLRAHPECHPGFTKNDLISKAMTNDFSGFEDEVESSSLSSSLPSSTPVSEETLVDESSISTPGQSQRRQSSPVQSDGASQIRHSTYSLAMVNPSSSSSSEIGAPSLEVTSVAASVASEKSTTPVIFSSVDMPTPANTLTPCTAAGDLSTSQQNPVLSNSGEDSRKRLQTSATASWTPESGYARPRYFTMNPLCIPSELLNFKPKK